MHGHKCHQRYGRCLRCHQRYLRCLFAMRPHMAAQICPKEAENRAVRHILTGSRRCRREWRANILADRYVTQQVQFTTNKFTRANLRLQRRVHLKTSHVPPSTCSFGRKSSFKRASCAPPRLLCASSSAAILAWSATAHEGREIPMRMEQSEALTSP